ncbi:MAG: single-stranded DNA-binding protein [Micromonosporaceae bacterium]
MHDTYVTVTGNLVTKPERRRLESNGSTVVNFRVGSTSRRFDKATGSWVDGNSFFVKVSCWRGLADNAYQSLFKGDPVVVTGRLYTREYQGEDGLKRTSYEMEAAAVGHNLARGTSTFTRTRAVPPADAVAADAAEPTETVDDTAEDPVEDDEAESYPYQRLGEPVAVSG